MCVCVYVSMYGCMYVCVCVCVYIYIYINFFFERHVLYFYILGPLRATRFPPPF